MVDACLTALKDSYGDWLTKMQNEELITGGGFRFNYEGSQKLDCRYAYVVWAKMVKAKCAKFDPEIERE